MAPVKNQRPFIGTASALVRDPRLRGDDRYGEMTQLHPVVEPQLLHFRQVPFRTSV